MNETQASRQMTQMPPPSLIRLNPERYYDPERFPRTNEFWTELVETLTNIRSGRIHISDARKIGLNAGLKVKTVDSLLREGESQGLLYRSRSNKYPSRIEFIYRRWFPSVER